MTEQRKIAQGIEAKKTKKEPKEHLDPVLVARGKRLREVRELMNMTLREFAQFSGCGLSSIGQWEQGRLTGLLEGSTRRIVMALQHSPVSCSMEWLLEGEGTKAMLKSQMPAPAVASPSVVASSPPTVLAPPLPIDNEGLLVEVTAFAHSRSDAVVLQVRDNAMAPFFKTGDYVGGYRCNAKDSAHLKGEVCIVQTLDGQMIVRLLEGQVEDSIQYRLSTLQAHSETEPVQIDVPLLSIALVLRLWRSSVH